MSKEDFKAITTQMDQVAADTEEQLTKLEDLGLEEEVAKLLEEFNTARHAVTDVRNQVQALAEANKNKEAYDKYVAEVKDADEDMTAKIAEIGEIQQKKADTVSVEALSLLNTTKRISIIITVIAIIISISYGVLISGLITKPIKKLQELMGRIAENDLTVHMDYESKDELGLISNDFNHMASNLKGMMATITESAEQVGSTSEELYATVEEVSTKVGDINDMSIEISKASEETSATSEEINASVQEVAASIQELTQKAMDGSEESEKIKTRALDINKKAEISTSKTENLRKEKEKEILKAIEDGKVVEGLL